MSFYVAVVIPSYRSIGKYPIHSSLFPIIELNRLFRNPRQVSMLAMPIDISFATNGSLITYLIMI